MAAIGITAANFKPSKKALMKRGTAVGTLVRSNPVVFDDVLGGFKAASAINLATAVKGLAAQDVGAGQDFLYVVEDPELDLGATTPISAGDSIWLHGTAGSLTKTAADLVSTWVNVFFGSGIGNGKMNFKITQGGQIP